MKKQYETEFLGLEFALWKAYARKVNIPFSTQFNLCVERYSYRVVFDSHRITNSIIRLFDCYKKPKLTKTIKRYAFEKSNKNKLTYKGNLRKL